MSASRGFGHCPDPCNGSCHNPESGHGPWFDNFTFGLNFPSLNGSFCDVSNNRQYWLQPGMEDILPNTHNPMDQFMIGSGCFDGSLNILHGYETTIKSGDLTEKITLAKNVKYLNTPRSMAVGYNKISIDGLTVHLTEIGTIDSSFGRVIASPIEPWTYVDLYIYVWAFCKTNSLGFPVKTNLPEVSPKTINLSDSKYIQKIGPIKATEASMKHETSQHPHGAGGGSCKYYKLHTPLDVGIKADNNDKPLFLAVSFKAVQNTKSTINHTYKQHDFKPMARSISVTLHGESSNLTDMNLT